MKSKGVFTVTSDGLHPQDTRAQLVCSTLEIGSRVLCWVHKARYPEHNALAWSIFTKIGEPLGLPPESIYLWLKHETGRVDLIKMPDGSIKENPQSLAFESMGQAEYQQWWNEALVVIKEKIIHRLPQEVYLELREMMIGKTDA